MPHVIGCYCLEQAMSDLVALVAEPRVVKFTVPALEIGVEAKRMKKSALDSRIVHLHMFCTQCFAHRSMLLESI